MSTGSSKVNAKDVIAFFKTADLELAMLALELAGEAVGTRTGAHKAAADRMAKARAGRGKKVKAPVAPAEAGTGQATGQAPAAVTEAPVAAQVQPSPIAQARARRAAAGSVPAVPAPAHTAEATSAESDTVLS